MAIQSGGPTDYKYYKHSEILNLEITDKPLEVLGFGSNIEYNSKFLLTERPNGRLDYQIIYIKTGKQKFLIGDKETVLDSNTIVLYRPGEPQRYQGYADNSYRSFVHFSGNQVSQILEKYGIENSVITFKDEFTVFDEMINKMEVERGNPFLVDICNGLFLYLLAMIGNYQKKARAPIAHNHFGQMLQLMRETYAENYSIEYYANFLGYSKGYFIRYFKDKLYVTPQQYLLQLRIKNAKKLLFYSEKSISEISSLVGYDDVHYFYKSFKKQTGSTPSEYRQTKRKSTQQ